MANDLQAQRDKYVGAQAEQYEAARIHKPVWSIEQQAIEDAVINGPVLDIPVGTGRYLPIYDQKGLSCVGMDVSPDMLYQASLKQSRARLMQGSILDIPSLDNHYKTAVCTRLLNWLEPDLCQVAIRELCRVAETVIVSIRIGEQAQLATITHTWDTVLDALDGRWIADNRLLLDEADRGEYRLLTIRKPVMADVLPLFRWNRGGESAFERLHVEWCERYQVPVFEPGTIRCEYLTGRDIYRSLQVMAEIEPMLLAENAPHLAKEPRGDGPIVWVSYGKGLGQLDGRHRAHKWRDSGERFPVFICSQ